MKLWTIEYKHSGLKGTYKSNLRAKTKEEAMEKFEQKKYNEKNKVLSVYEKEEKKTVKKMGIRKGSIVKTKVGTGKVQRIDSTYTLPLFIIKLTEGKNKSETVALTESEIRKV